jgi:hypothetical protein
MAKTRWQAIILPAVATLIANIVITRLATYSREKRYSFFEIL